MRRAAGPYGITDHAAGAVYYASLAGSYLGRIDIDTGEATVLAAADSRSGRAPGLGGLAGPDLGQRVERRQGRPVRPGDAVVGASGGCRAPRRKPYAVYVDEGDTVWLSDFGANALVRFDPRTERFTTRAAPRAPAEVRQLLGRERRGGAAGVGRRQARRRSPALSELTEPGRGARPRLAGGCGRGAGTCCSPSGR